MSENTSGSVGAPEPLPEEYEIDDAIAVEDNEDEDQEETGASATSMCVFDVDILAHGVSFVAGVPFASTHRRLMSGSQYQSTGTHLLQCVCVASFSAMIREFVN